MCPTGLLPARSASEKLIRLIIGAPSACSINVQVFRRWNLIRRSLAMDGDDHHA